MKATRRICLSGKTWPLPVVLLLALLALFALVAGCGGGEEEAEETTTPGATSTAAATATAKPTGTAAVTPKASPAATRTGSLPGVTDTQIIFGMHSTMSGTTGAMYKMVGDAFLTYIKYVNAEKGGVCGREIVMKREDDQGDYSKALEVTRKMVEEENVLGLVGSLGPHDAAAEYLNENGVPDLMIFSFGEKFDDPQKYPWITVSVGSWYLEGRNFANYIKEKFPGKKVGHLYVNSVAGRDQARGLKDFIDPGNPLVAQESYEETAVDIRSQVLKLKEAGAEVVVFTTSIPYTAQGLKQADRIGLKPDGLLLEYGNCDALLFNYVDPTLAVGAIGFQAFKMPEWTDDPAVAEHARIMAEYGGPAASTFTVLMQTMGEILVETLNRTCDDLSREGVMKATLSFQGDTWCPSLMYPGTCLSTSPTDHRVVSQGVMMQVALENGKVVWTDTGFRMDFEK